MCGVSQTFWPSNLFVSYWKSPNDKHWEPHFLFRCTKLSFFQLGIVGFGVGFAYGTEVVDMPLEGALLTLLVRHETL